MVKTIFLTNDEDQNSVACEMPTTLAACARSMCVGGVDAFGAFAFLPAGRGAYHECGAVFDEWIHACRRDAKLGGETRKCTASEDRKLKRALCQNLRRS